MRRVLVTGGTGYLGRALVDAAIGRGVDVVATWHVRRPDDDRPRWEHLDVRDPDAVARVVAAAAPDVIVHTAYVPSGPDLPAVTAAGSGAVAAGAVAGGARLVHVSTDVVFDGEKAGRYVEDDEPRPVHDYGRAKLEAERLVAAADPTAVVVRAPLLCGGPGNPAPHERLVVDALDGAADVTFFTDEVRCPVWVSELAAALLDVAATDVAGPLHLAGAEAVSRAELARRVALAHARDPAGLRTGASPGGARPRNCALDSGRAYSLLGRELAGP